MRRTPVMALTASAMQGDRERALALGFTAYITKPIRLAALRSEVERLLSESMTAPCPDSKRASRC